jgi:uncharacterized membrane protein YdjX (TVP38/TMEM64 family)
MSIINIPPLFCTLQEAFAAILWIMHKTLPSRLLGHENKLIYKNPKTRRMIERSKIIYRKHRAYILSGMLAASLIFAIVYFNSLNLTVGSTDQLRQKLEGFGPWSPLILIVLISVELIFLPLPASVIATMVGYMYGPLEGTLYSYIAYSFVAVIAFLVSRRFGRPLIEKIIPDDKLAKYDMFIRSKGKYALWFAYIFPFFPNVTTSFVIGLSRMRMRRFIIYPLIGYIPNLFILNYLGHLLAVFGVNIFHLALVAILAVVLFIFYGIFQGKGKQYNPDR